MNGGGCHSDCRDTSHPAWNPEQGWHTEGVHIPGPHHGCHNGMHIEEAFGESTVAFLSILKVKEGYATEVKNNIRCAVFDQNHDSYLDIDSEKNGQLDQTLMKETEFGWKAEERNIQNIYNEIVQHIKSKENDSKHANLGVVYRPTVDLGLYDDVQKAVVTISSASKGVRTNEYVYDKREANGTSFKFGVNKYDLENSKNNVQKTIKDVENDYASYYGDLSNGILNYGENQSIKDIYEALGERIEDIEINTAGTDSITTGGTAVAGYYEDYDVDIKLTYKIKVYNQSAVTSWVTHVLDYYSEDFTVTRVYEKTSNGSINEIHTWSDAINIPTTKGYKAIDINLGEKQLEGNGFYEIYVELKMGDGTKNPKTILGNGILDTEEGYKTYNYAEINGYRTEIGVIDIDSSPGDLIPEKRFESGPYDDDEGKSPALIFKNPENASRLISGMVYEDETGVEIVTGAERNRTGSTTPVAGAIVKLIEVDQSGMPVASGKEPSGENEPGLRAKTLTTKEGTYTFDKIVAGNYIVKFEYGSNYSTVLKNPLESGSLYSNVRTGRYLDLANLSNTYIPNKRSYNGQDYESTLENVNVNGDYWYRDTSAGTSYAADNPIRRNEVILKSQTLTNHIAEVFNSYKDSEINYGLLDELINDYYMYGETPKMLLEIEYYGEYPEQIVNTSDTGYYEKEYKINNINFGIVERERAEIEITKKVSEISIVDSAGRTITSGTYDDLKAGNIKYVKMVPNTDEARGFIDMEIDKELLSGATLKVIYEITVTNNSEKGNTLDKIEVVDYVSNNLNYDSSYGDNANNWRTVTLDHLKEKEYVNSTSLNAPDDNTANRIDLSTYQTILMTTFENLQIGKENSQTRYLTLEKNLSSSEDSDFNYENQVEIVQSYNAKGRGDYSSIYGNLDPTTYTSKQGNLNWDATSKTKTDLDDPVTGNPNAIRLAEKDSGNAEEVIITPPTGAKGIVLQTYHYILALIGLTSIAVAIALIRKYVVISKK